MILDPISPDKALSYRDWRSYTLIRGGVRKPSVAHSNSIVCRGSPSNKPARVTKWAAGDELSMPTPPAPARGGLQRAKRLAGSRAGLAPTGPDG